MAPRDHAAISDVSCPADNTLPDLYRQGIAGCRAENAGDVGHVLMELIGALNFDYEEAATRLFEVYDECLRRVAERQFDVPLRVLERLASVFTRVSAVPLRMRSSAS